MSVIGKLLGLKPAKHLPTDLGRQAAYDYLTARQARSVRAGLEVEQSAADLAQLKTNRDSVISARGRALATKALAELAPVFQLAGPRGGESDRAVRLDFPILKPNDVPGWGEWFGDASVTDDSCGNRPLWEQRQHELLTGETSNG